MHGRPMLVEFVTEGGRTLYSQHLSTDVLPAVGQQVAFCHTTYTHGWTVLRLAHRFLVDQRNVLQEHALVVYLHEQEELWVYKPE